MSLFDHFQFSHLYCVGYCIKKNLTHFEVFAKHPPWPEFNEQVILLPDGVVFLVDVVLLGETDLDHRLDTSTKTGLLFAVKLGALQSLKNSKNQKQNLDIAHPTHPLSHPIHTFFLKPNTDMDRTLKSQ